MPIQSKSYPAKEYLDSRLDYCQLTGIFTWKNGNRSGKTAGNKYAVGYRITVNSGQYLLHRIAMIMQGIDIDGYEIDHINGNPYDNRLCNLRTATHHQNMCNHRRKVVRSGFQGVSKYGHTGLFRVRVNGVKDVCGFKHAIDAAVVRDAMLLKKAGEYGALNFPRSLYMFIATSPQ